jgi:hypothetical protein
MNVSTFNEVAQAGKVTVYVKDNKSPGDTNWHDPLEYYSVRYALGYGPNGRPNGRAFYYLVIQPEALRCPTGNPTAQASCQSASHTVSVSSRGMDSLSGTEDTRVNKPALYATATMVGLSSSGAKSFSVAVFVDDKTTDEWVPIGSTAGNDPFSLDLTGKGAGMAVSLKIDVVGDGVPGNGQVLQKAGEGIVTAFIKDNKGGWRDNGRGVGEDGLDVMFLKYKPAQGPPRVRYYLKLGALFNNCQDSGPDSCAAAANSVMLTVRGGTTFALGNTDAGSDPLLNQNKGLYQNATKVALADAVTKADLSDLIAGACLLNGNRRRGSQAECMELVNPSASTADGSTIGIAVGAVVGVLVVAGAAFMFSRRQGSEAARSTVSFDNPLYDTGDDLQFKAPAESATESAYDEGATGGYMDVGAAEADGAEDTGGYMDVSAAPDDNGDV